MFFACAAVAGCAAPRTAQTASDLQRASLGVPAMAALAVGCWSLAWRDVEPVGAPDGGALPDSVRLRDEAVFGTPERLVAPATHPSGRGVRGGETPWEARYVLNRWWIEDGGLRVRFSDGEREEWLLTLAVDAQELSGSARRRADPGAPPGPSAAGVGASRIACEYE